MQPPDRPLRLALLGIGNELRGDDAAGGLVAQALQDAAADSTFLCLVAGVAPENCTGRLRRFQPDLVLLVDAADMDEPPGAIRWLDWQAITGLSATTHITPLHMLAHYLTFSLGCQVALIGIQPADTRLGAPLSPAVSQAVNQLASGLRPLIPTTP